MQGADKTLGCQTDDFTGVFVFLIWGVLEVKEPPE